MRINIKTADIDIQYVDDFTTLEDHVKDRLIDIINELTTNQIAIIKAKDEF